MARRYFVSAGGFMLMVAGYGRGAIDLINLPGDISDAWKTSMSIIGYAPWVIGTIGVAVAVGALIWPKISPLRTSTAAVQVPAVNPPVEDNRRVEQAVDVATQERLAKLDALTARLHAQEQAEADRVRARERKEAAIVALDMSERMTIQPRGSKMAMSKIGMNMQAIQMLQNSLANIGYDHEFTEKLKADVEAEYKADAQYLAMNEKDHDIWPAATDKRQYLIFCEQRRRMIELIKGVAGRA
ncbi:hypothetical protein [Sphingomonas sp. IW22]|uniref:hypothetical protein n=1 Tax=Sphingomonas sp. IW22 TaxID=3242489 RepID=UPI0035200D3F